MNFIFTESFYFCLGLFGALILIFVPKLLSENLLKRSRDYYEEEGSQE